ncbi:MAG: cysteine desulfurase family protein [Deltaproteobacteria bacterium]|nr:cysteine desulfurase family protein [Deltaproteobacteria bacterium]
MSRLYFDYNATTPLPAAVSEALAHALRQDWKNPSSVHQEGREARKILEAARERIALQLGSLESEIILTSGATEANNAVFHSVWEGRTEGRNRIVTTAVEHESVVRPLSALAKKGADVRFLSVNAKGELNPEELDEVLRQTLLLSVMMANNETGILFPIKKLAEKAHAKGILFHTDAVCAGGKIPLSFSELGVDFLTLSGHKFYSPKGAGLLLVKEGTDFHPQILGGPQERGRRAGTENLIGTLGLAASLDFALKGIDEENVRLFALRDRLKKGLSERIPGVVFNENGANQLSGTLSASFPGHSGQTLLARLDLEGVAVSYGAACSSGSLEVSRVLLAMGIPEKRAASSIRISFGRLTTGEEVDRLLEIFRKIL